MALSRLLVTTTPQNLLMNEPKSVTANFSGIPTTTITTNPPGLQITVDSVTLTAPQSFQWTPGSSHTIATSTLQAGPSGTQHLFANWSDGGAISHTITASSAPATYTASFTTQYYLTTGISPPGTGTISPASGWHNAAAAVTISAAAGAGYQFSGFTGALTGTATPQNLLMNEPKSVTANFSGIPTITITTNPPGLQITVDSVTLTAPQSFQWTPGSSHTIGVTTFQGSGGARHVFSGWSDNGSARHVVAAPSSSVTYTANFTYTSTASTIQGPSWLQVGLSYIPFDVYDYAHTASSHGFPYSCPGGSSVRECFKTVLRELPAQGVTGVRIFFTFCGDPQSTPLSGCGQNWRNVTGPNAAWVANVRE
jgi:hypothetical protein